MEEKISPENPIKVPSAKPDDQPATRRMLFIVRDGLRADMAALKAEMAAMKSDIAGMKTDIAGMKTDIAGMKTDIANIKIDMAEMKGMIHQSNLLAEEQRADNRIVLEGLQLLWERQERLERAD